MNARMQFPAPWSAVLRVITLLVLALLVGAAVTVLVTPQPASSAAVGRWVAFGAVPAGILIAALFTIRGYVLGPGELRVRRLLWDTCIPLAGLQRAEANPAAARASIRVWGNGGFFSFSGWYYNRQLGRYRMLVTDPARGVVLHFAGRRPLVVSPADPAAFVLAVMACSGGAGR